MATNPSSLDESNAVSPPQAGAPDGWTERGSEVPENTRPAGRTARAWLRLHTTLDLIRANPTGRIALKIVIGLLGALVVALGAALIPLPGPGWLIVIAGLAIWAIEFHWARRLLAFTRRNVRAWTTWVGRRSWPIRVLLGTVGLVFVGVVVWLSLKVGLGIDVFAMARDVIEPY
ncbi:TIGR02611 family protein [Plantactinospora sp. GCM10030261]|uniref:TIGR02611 family protein n=1 Tax=Plantactinospora sp. GCM10030261 TaxID=3273420 RepID=UPI00360D572D